MSTDYTVDHHLTDREENVHVGTETTPSMTVSGGRFANLRITVVDCRRQAPRER